MVNHSKTKAWRYVSGGVLAAIVITTSMDATGFTMFSALPLLPLAGLLWFLQRFSMREFGLTWGTLRGHLLALAYPAVVLGAIAALALAVGAIDTSAADWHETLLNVVLGSTVGVVMVMLTEEGFFRGWLWAALRRAGQSEHLTLLWSSLAFTLWHVSAISLDTGFDIPAAEIPVFLINATLIGAVFGMLRMATGSVLVASVCHAVWNAIDYPLFGFGERVGALGIQDTHLFGPEVGVVGVAVNLLAATALWLYLKRQRSGRPAAHAVPD